MCGLITGFTPTDCHIWKKKKCCFFMLFSLLLMGEKSATVVAKGEQHNHWQSEKPLQKQMVVHGRCKFESEAS
jgi:hypothetical protein